MGIYHHVIVKMMKQIRDLEFQYIVATDLAARGIDIEGLAMLLTMSYHQI